MPSPVAVTGGVGAGLSEHYLFDSNLLDPSPVCNLIVLGDLVSVCLTYLADIFLIQLGLRRVKCCSANITIFVKSSSQD